MSKYSRVLGGHDAEPVRRPRVAGRLVFVALLAASPLLYEGGAVVVARWRTMLGTYQEVRTPVYDRLTEAWRDTSDRLRTSTPSVLHLGRWNPVMAVPGVVAMALAGTFFLRRGH